MIAKYKELHDFAEVIPISALKGEGLDKLLDAVVKALPEGPRYFPKDQVTDQPERFLVAELIREQVLLVTEQEVPYATTVLIEQYEESARLTRIAATIYCERDGQKAILIGKQGSDAEEDRHGSASADRETAEHQGLPRAVREGEGGLARFAAVRAGDRLAHAVGAYVGKGRLKRGRGCRSGKVAAQPLAGRLCPASAHTSSTFHSGVAPARLATSAATALAKTPQR